MVSNNEIKRAVSSQNNLPNQNGSIYWIIVGKALKKDKAIHLNFENYAAGTNAIGIRQCECHPKDRNI